MEYTKVKLGDILTSISETISKEQQTAIFLNTSDISEGKFLHKRSSVVKELPGQAKKKIKNGDILFSEIRPKNKRYAVVDVSNPNDYVVSTKLMVLRIKDPSKYYLQYIYQQLISQKMLHQINEIAESRSGTFPQITFDAIKNIELTPPPLEEQKRIADIFTVLDDKIELNNQMNQTLEEIASLLYKRWFVDFEFPDDKGNPYKSSGGEMVDSELGMIPKGWEVKKIFEISNVGIGKTPPRKEQGWFLNSKGVNWFSIKDMGNIKSPYIFHSSERLSKRAIDQFNVKIVPKNTVILSFKLTIGRIAITTMDSVTNEAIAQFQILNENVTTEYMYLYFKNLNFMNFGSTSSIATAINSQIIKSIPVIVPIDTINRGFSNILIRYFKMMKENSIESDKLNKIRELLLIELI